MIKRLLDLLGELDKVHGWIIAAATTGPIAQYVVGWGPPWPDQQFMVALAAAVLQILASMWAVTFWSGRSIAKTVFVISTLLFFVLASLYIYMFIHFTRYIPKSDARVVIGTEMNDNVPTFIHERFNDDLSEAIHEWAVEKIYRDEGLERNRTMLLFGWLGLYLSLSVGMTAFVGQTASPAGGADENLGSSTP
jgi:hypothetical protein